MRHYPVITEENFEEVTSYYVLGKRLRVPKPRTKKEFYEMTKNMYGVGLSLKECSVGFYKVQGKQSVYDRLPIPSLWNSKYGQYNGLKIFLNHTFGELYCGGVAGSHYGQYRYGYRDKLRLTKLCRSEYVPTDQVALG